MATTGILTNPDTEVDVVYQDLGISPGMTRESQGHSAPARSNTEHPIRQSGDPSSVGGGR